jgi:hypothetical protein
MTDFKLCDESLAYYTAGYILYLRLMDNPVLCNWLVNGKWKLLIQSTYWLSDLRHFALVTFFFSSGATAPILALAYLLETLCFTSVY